VGQQSKQCPENKKWRCWQTWDQGQHDEQRRSHGQRLGLGQNLPANIAAEMAALFLRGNAGNENTGRRGNGQRRNLSNQAFANGKERVRAQGGGDIHALHEHADDEAAHDVGDEHDDARNGIAFDEFHGTVHRAKELGFARQQGATPVGLVGIDMACPQFGVDGHLLAWHGVQGETRPDLGHAPRAFRNHDELDCGQNKEHGNSNDEIAGHYESAEGVNDLAGIGLEQDEPRGRHFKGKPEQGCQQQADLGKLQFEAHR
jgi:hypothetical protein